MTYVRQRRHPRANTLLEVTAAVTLIATALYPGLKYMRDAMEQSRRNDSLNMLATYCVATLEQQLCIASASWTEATVVGDFSADGYAQHRFTAKRSQQVIDGGVVNQLMAVTVTVYQDLNGNGSLDVGEPNITLASKAAKLSKYQSVASGS